MANRYRFGPYRLDPEALVLERDGRPVALRSKLVETLAALVENAPEVASKDELMRRVWPDVTVVESSLTRNISELRSELETGCPGQIAIETLPKRGYRFVLPVSEENGARSSGRQPRSRKLLVAALVFAAAILLGARSLTMPDAAAPPESVALAAFRSGLALYDSWTPRDLEAAQFHFDRSIRAAPELWHGHFGSTMAQTAALLLSGQAPPEAKARLLATADRAVLYGPEAAVTHAARGSALLIASWDWDGAARELEAAIEWNPKDSLAYERRGLLNTLRGRFDEARRDYDRALELRPDFDDCRLSLAFNEFCALRYDDAIAGVLETLPQTKKQQAAHRLLALSYAAKGDWADAEHAAGKGAVSDFGRAELALLRSCAQGRVEEARETREQLAAICAADRNAYCDSSVSDVALGDHDAAFAVLEDGLRRRHWRLLWRLVDPRLEPLRADPRWDRLRDAVHLVATRPQLIDRTPPSRP